MKLSLIISTLIFVATATATAAMAPGYANLKKMDAAVSALAGGSGKTGLASKKPGDVILAGARMSKDKSGMETITADTGGAKCAIAIISKAPPKGMAGSATYSAKVLKCSRYLNIRAPDVMKYEDIRAVLGKAAASGKIDLSFRVVGSPQGPSVKLSN